MIRPLVVVGAGGFGRETLDVVAAINAVEPTFDLRGVIDSGPSRLDLERLGARGVRYLGSADEWLRSCAGDERFIVGIGSPRVRRRIAGQFEARGLRAAILVHPRAELGTKTTLGAGVVVTAGVQVSTNVTLRDHVHLNPGSIVGHDSELEAFVSVNPGAIISGNVRVRQGALIGAGATVLQGLEVGASALVGAGACVTRDVAGSVTVVGIPARPLQDAKREDH